jgi:hypothetical protein
LRSLKLQAGWVVCCLLFLGIAHWTSLSAQETLGAITGTVTDSSGAAVPDATVKALNKATNLAVTEHTQGNGSYSVPELPAGMYQLTFTKEGFETETHTEVLVNANRTSTVDASLKVGSVSATVEVTATPLMNQTDTTNGYVVDQLTIQDTPLGTGSFTQLAILSPGVHADFLSGAGTNAGLGNQAIFSNGNRDTSNSFALNGVGTNNLFNGNSTSSVGENRFVLNTGENFAAGNSIQTSTSVYGAIGQALPTPPPDAIQEIAVNAAMYDASQGNNSGAHISVITKSGTNQIHGSAWELFQNSDMNAAPFFNNASPAVTDKVPFTNRNQYGVTFGGPITKDKLFYFLSYQGIRAADATDATQDVTVPLGLTDDRSPQGIVNMLAATNGKTITTAQISPVSLALFQAKLPNGQYLIPSAQITNPTLARQLGYDAVVQGPNAQESVDQGIGDIDYNMSDKDRLSAKVYIQRDPTSDPFGAVGALSGFPQQLLAGSDVGSLTNTVILSPTLTWEQHAGITRMQAYSHTSQDFTPSSIGMNLLGSNNFPQIEISAFDPTLDNELEFGQSASFANAGLFQNQWEYGSTLNWVKGRHTISVGGLWQHTQLNVINNNTGGSIIDFHNLTGFVEGSVYGGDAFTGAASRYYRADTAGVFVNDNYKLRSNLTVTLGVRWDYDGPFTEKYGRLTAFDPGLYAYNASSDTITNSGLEIAGSSSNSLMQHNQSGFAPRIGIAWSPLSKVTVRAGYGIFYDRGELFSYFSAGAGSGFNGPFGVTLAPPYVEPIAAKRNASFATPFGTTVPAPPSGTAAGLLAILPNLSQTGSGDWPAGDLSGPFLFAGYNQNNKLPYTQNWSFDVQYQPGNSWLIDIGYVGNHGTHEVLPVPFNQAEIATPQSPVNGQIYSYGGVSALSSCNSYPAPGLAQEQICPPPYYAGNAAIRVPYLGYDFNSLQYDAEGISNYSALQVQLRRRFANGLQFTTSYTWSHALDEQSGLGLFVTGNNPQDPKSNYGNADFDQTHVFLINYSYTVPAFRQNRSLNALVSNWVIGGQTVAESGQPYSVYDYSGGAASLFYGTYDEVGNPIIPLAPGVSNSQAQLQGTTGVNPSKPVLNAADFVPVYLAPGQDGVPPCDATGCDLWNTAFGYTGRNTFRGPFQVRFDVTLARQFAIGERFKLRFEADGFNLFNHPDFDTPNSNVTTFPYFESPPSVPPVGSLGYIQHTIGSPRFLQLGLHLYF